MSQTIEESGINGIVRNYKQSKETIYKSSFLYLLYKSKFISSQALRDLNSLETLDYLSSKSEEFNLDFSDTEALNFASGTIQTSYGITLMAPILFFSLIDRFIAVKFRIYGLTTRLSPMKLLFKYVAPIYPTYLYISTAVIEKNRMIIDEIYNRSSGGGSKLSLDDLLD